MALIGNRSSLLKSPGRFLAGGPVCVMRSAFNTHAMQRGAYPSYSAKSATPDGHLSPSAWVLPTTAGGISSRNNSVLTLGAAGAGAMGRNTSGSATLVLDLVGTASLVSSTSGAASLSLGASGNIFASKSTSGSAGITLGGSGTVLATGSVAGTAAITFAAQWAPYAVGWLSGTTADQGLTVSGLTNAIWGAAAANYTESGSMGAKLNSAASGGVDYASMADAVRVELQAELLRIAELAQLHGLVVGADLVVTPTSRMAGDVTQSIATAGNTTTVTRTP